MRTVKSEVSSREKINQRFHAKSRLSMFWLTKDKSLRAALWSHKPFGYILRGTKIAQELLRRDAPNVADAQPVLASVQEKRLALGIIRHECLEGLQVLRSNAIRVFHLDGPESGLAIDNEVHLDSRAGPPIEEVDLALRIGDPGSEVLCD